jgi:acetyl esterase/lipase
MNAPSRAAEPRGLDPRARRFLDGLAAGARRRAAPLDLAALRAAAEALAGFASPPPPVERRDQRIGASHAVAVRRYAPLGQGDALLPTLIYFHGGGWISGSLASHDALCATLAARGACRVIAVDYRLAPEHRFPAAIEDGEAVLDAIAADPERFGVDRRRLGVAGDSAGANLAVVVARRAPAPLALQLLLCPVMQPLGRTRSRKALGSGYLIEETTMARYWDLYRVADLDPDDPHVAPLNGGELARLPRALVHLAEFDPLRDEGEDYVVALRQAGVSAALTIHAGMLHHFYGLGAAIPAGQAGLERIGEELRSVWGGIG